MKKSFVKSLSAFLALVLILSVLPMAAFAAEIEEHEHTDSCCVGTTSVMPAMTACADGEHIYSVYYTCLYVDCGGVHRADEVIMHDCVNCLDSYYEYTGYSEYVDHSYSKTAVGTDPDSNLTVYKYTCVCGKSYYGN